MAIPLTLSFNDFELRYLGRRSGGGLEFSGFAAEDAAAPLPGVDIVAAPSGPLNMDVTTVHTHQIGVAVPLGHRR